VTRKFKNQWCWSSTTDRFIPKTLLSKRLAKKIWQLNSENKYFTVDDLLQYAKEELEYAGERTTLWGILKSMGIQV
jgi:hypothetical protein